MSKIVQKTFETIIQKEGSKSFVVLPFSPSEAWGKRSQYHITGTIKDFPIRGSLKEMGQEFVIRLGPAWFRDSGYAPGDTVIVHLSLEGPQVENVSQDIAEALIGSPKAKAFFEGLPTFYRNNYIRWIESAKREETRSKRIREMVDLLEDGKRRK